MALSELDRLNRVFQDILDMARIDAAAITAERDWVTPADVVDASVARLGQRARRAAAPDLRRMPMRSSKSIRD